MIMNDNILGISEEKVRVKGMFGAMMALAAMFSDDIIGMPELPSLKPVKRVKQDRPFIKGDKVIIEDRKGNRIHEGIIIEIGSSFARVYNPTSQCDHRHSAEWYPMNGARDRRMILVKDIEENA